MSETYRVEFSPDEYSAKRAELTAEAVLRLVDTGALSPNDTVTDVTAECKTYSQKVTALELTVE
jgi:hypothetical protein